MKRVTKVGLLAGLMAAASMGSVSAQSLTVGSATGQPGATVNITVDFEAGGGAAGYQGRFTYDTAAFGLPVATNAAATCTVNDVAGEISVFRTTFPPAVIGANEAACTIAFPIEAAAAFAVYPLPLDDADTRFSDTGGVEAALDHTDGQIEVVDAPPDVVLSFAPPSGGTVTFAGGTQGDTVSEQIDITGGGNAGTGTVDNCAFTGADAGAFSVTSAQPIAVNAGAAGTIDLDCVLDDVAQSATLTCDVDDSNGASQASWTMSCPAGTPIPAPEYSSDPAPGSDITCNGAAGSTVNRTVTISNTGNPTDPAGGVDEQLTYSCSTTGANFSVASGGTDTLNVGESTDVVVACTVPLEGEPTATGSLDCTSDDAGQPTASYGLSSSIVTAPPPVPQPNIVPAGSLWSKLLLIGLLAGLGGLIVALRRQ